MITVKSTGSFSNTENYIKRMQKLDVLSILHSVGEAGVQALYTYTPKDTGLTAASWSYQIEKRRKGWRVFWTNDNVDSGGVQVAILLQYGHGTRGGGFVQGVDYINPALKPIFDQVIAEIWREVSR